MCPNKHISTNLKKKICFSALHNLILVLIKIPGMTFNLTINYFLEFGKLMSIVIKHFLNKKRLKTKQLSKYI